MEKKYLNIVAYDVPSPPDYGGIVDIYYKVKALSELGVRINLHCFMYRHEKYSEELAELCENVYYYKRETFLANLSGIPQIVNSRRSDNLFFNLLQNDHPILFEGIHTCYYLNAPELSDRKKMVRIQDIEPEYYYNLYKNAPASADKFFYYLESVRLKKYEKIFAHADTLITLNVKHKEYYEKLFPGKEIINIEPFSMYSDVQINTGQGAYALYHSNLSEMDNRQAAVFLIREVLKDSGVPFVIAGKDPDSELKHLCKENKVKIVANLTNEKLDGLIRNAQVNIMVSFTPSGSKSKIYPALYHGRHCLVNSNMVRGFSYTKTCHISDSAAVLRSKLIELMATPFSEEEVRQRAAILGENSSQKKAEALYKLF